MSFDFNAVIDPDGSVEWRGLSTGKTEVVSRNNKEGLIAFFIAGHNYWAGIGDRAYAPAHFVVCQFETVKREGDREIIRVDFFGSRLEWNTRRPWKE